MNIKYIFENNWGVISGVTVLAFRFNSGLFTTWFSVEILNIEIGFEIQTDKQLKAYKKHMKKTEESWIDFKKEMIKELQKTETTDKRKVAQPKKVAAKRKTTK